MNFPVYQIDFAVMAAGKRVASTKRRIRWYDNYDIPLSYFFILV
jgi:hypothetical protein